MATEPAFPGDRFPGSKDKHSGMSLRDYFAGQALPEILAQKDVHDGREFENAAWIAYRMADAMMEARNK